MNSAKRLTVGILAQNGLPHIQHCLAALDSITSCSDIVDFILVDSASSDDTLNAMLSFARGRADTRVLAMRGQVNQSATRNQILSLARPGDVFLVDGDVAIEKNFVVEALREIRKGNAQVVYGQLPEVWHTADHIPYQEAPDRYKVTKKEYMDSFKGIVMLGEEVLAGGQRYDENMRRFEDIEFSIRVAERFRVLALPIIMGTHYTMHYHSAGRIGDFYKNSYQRPAGVFIRKNILRPVRLWRAREAYSGNIIGLLEQGLLALGALSISSGFTLAIGIMIFADYLRFVKQGRVNQFIPLRLIGAWQLLSGFIKGEKVQLGYDSELVYDVDKNNDSLGVGL